MIDRHRQLLRLSTLATVLCISGCSGGNSNSPMLAGTVCDPGTQVQLANPQPGQTSVSGNIGSVVVVASDSNNTIYNTVTQWNVLLTYFWRPSYRQSVTLGAVPSGPHPYQRDFYYSSDIPTLPSGSTWSAYLSMNTGCTPLFVGQFST